MDENYESTENVTPPTKFETINKVLVYFADGPMIWKTSERTVKACVHKQAL